MTAPDPRPRLDAEPGCPALVRASGRHLDLFRDAPALWREAVRDAVLRHGAVLFRGFPVGSLEAFEAFVEAAGPPDAWIAYPLERATPRSTVRGFVMTSTEYHPQGSIYLHNECCHRRTWPLRLFFTCRQPAQSGGATPVADVRAVTRALADTVAPLFEEAGVCYVRNYGGEFGAGLTYSFGTDERDAIEHYCATAGLAWEWLGERRLRTRARFPVHRRHPATGERLWFNNLAFYHPSSIERRVRLLLAGIPREELAFGSYHGDGGTIADEIVAECRAAYDRYTTRFDWQAEDVLLLDNMLTAHGRDAFRGERTVWVAMTEETTEETGAEMAA